MNTLNTRHSGLLAGKYREFFIPTILMAMTTTMSIVVDSIIVGNLLGSAALAAVNLVMPVMMAYTTIAVLLGMGAATVISVAKGRRQDEYADTIFTTAVGSMAVLSLLLMAGQAIFLEDIARLLTEEASLRPLVTSYLRVLMYGTPMIVMTMGVSYCLRVDGRVKLASTILIAANMVNLALDLVYMGPLEMGIAGSSLATVSGYAIGMLLLLSYVFSSRRTLRFRPGGFLPSAESLQNIREIVATGSPAAMGSVLITLKILAINTIVLSVAGKSGMVAFSVCISCLSLVSMFISGAAQAMTPIVGVLYGEDDHTGIRFVVKRAVIILLSATFAAIVILEAEPGLILRLFGVSHAADMAAGIPAIRIFAVSLAGTSISFLAMYFYMTTGRRKISNAIAVVQGFAVVVPTAWLLSRVMGISGVWIAFSVAEAATIIMVTACFFSMKKAHPDKYRDILLLDRSQLPDRSALEMTSSNTAEDIETTLGTLTAFLKTLSIGPERAASIQSAVRAMLSNIATHGYPPEKTNYIDIMVRVLGERIVVALRDGGKDFNPGPYWDEQDPAGSASRAGSGLSLVRALTETRAYSRTIGFNNNILTFQRTAM